MRQSSALASFGNFITRPAVAFSLAALVSLVLHWRIFSTELVGPHAWRQTLTQQNIYHFAKDDLNIFSPRIHFQAQPGGIVRMEFPLMQWLIGIVDRVFGYSLLVTRICLFIIGLFSIAGMMKLVSVLFHNRLGTAIAGWTFCFSPVFFYYTMNPIPDVLALCLGIWGMAYWFDWLKNKKTIPLVACGLLLALSALVKLPFILYFVVFLLYPFQNRRNGFLRSVVQTIPGGIFVLLPLAWYAWVVPGWINPVVTGIFDADGFTFAAFREILWGNFSSTLPELLINYGSLLFFLAGIFFFFRNKRSAHPFTLYLASIAFLVTAYFFYEIHLISLIHDYYLFPFLPLIFILVTYGAINLAAIRNFRFAFPVIAAALPVIAFFRINVRWNEDNPGFNKDVLVYREEIRQVIPQKEWMLTNGDVSGEIWFYYIDRLGWYMYDDHIDTDFLDGLIDQGVVWFVSDYRPLEEKLQEEGYIEAPGKTFGSIKVFRLHKRPAH